MKSNLVLLFIFECSFISYSQNSILYDLDSYKRVDIDYRQTFFSPDVNLEYEKVFNTPSQSKSYSINIGGKYTDDQLFNDEKNQITKSTRIFFDLLSGDFKNISFLYSYDYVNRAYTDLKYFKNGFRFNNDSKYRNSVNSFAFKNFIQNLDISYDLGFGFGRLEVINNAWIGARILEELESKQLLTRIPEADEMKLFFDVIGDVENERVLDSRLAEMYRIEKLIEFVEQKEWIEEGSIPAFVIIYDAYRYENFLLRMSGKRLEFTLSPNINGSYHWQEFEFGSNQNFIQSGFEGKVEYEVHGNGDLEYYSSKLLGARMGYFERFLDDSQGDNTDLSGDVYFESKYGYFPSLRTNLLLSSTVFAGFINSKTYEATFGANVILEYLYYVSPATQLVFKTSLNYNDPKFQMGNFQPEIRANFSIDIVHAIR